MLQIKEPRSGTAIALLSRGFRPFFLAAAGFAILSVLIWMYVYIQGPMMVVHLPGPIWHAHEMIYGYAVAVVAGFLLTAVQNWTNRPMPSGLGLLGLLLLWLAGRILNLVSASVQWAAVVDCLFLFFLTLGIAIPIVNTRQWRNLSIVGILLGLFCAHLMFYTGSMELWTQGVHWGLYAGFYCIMTLVFIMARRVIPFFIQQGVGYPVTLRNNVWLDISSIVLFVLFWITELVAQTPLPGGVLAGLLFALHGYRLIGWYTWGIWRQPLLWVLYLGYGFLVLAFGLRCAASLDAIPVNLALHAFAYGGIGLITLGMMSRVSLGHTGRKVDQPPRLLNAVFIIFVIGAVIRVIFPLVAPSLYYVWIILSQLMWVIAFALFMLIYAPVLCGENLS